jgi:ribonuclease HII
MRQPTRKRAKPFQPEQAATYPVGIGCDEVGRGALCGPVVVAAVWFDPCRIPPELLAELDDSKKLSAKQRTRLSELIAINAKVAVAAGSVFAIDRRGIRVITLDAMRRAIGRLGMDATAYVDGVDVPPGLTVAAHSVVRGDSTIPQIAAASVVAKTFRDRLMTHLARRYPAYRWDRNAGYGTADHLAALECHGPTPHHRRSFKPVTELALRFGLEGRGAVTALETGGR